MANTIPARKGSKRLKLSKRFLEEKASFLAGHLFNQKIKIYR